MYNTRENDYQKYTSYIDTCNKYNYFVDDDINLYNLSNKLNKTYEIENDTEYYNGLIDLNKNIDKIFNSISNNMYSNKSTSFYDNSKKNKCVTEISNKKRELFTDFRQSNELYKILSKNSGNEDNNWQENPFVELKRNIEYKKGVEKRLRNNMIYSYLLTLLIILLIAIFLFIYL
tara:strand:- start:834 stop:1358 length:525 start_codon:yes stop_codon:yes gene_type:complete